MPMVRRSGTLEVLMTEGVNRLTLATWGVNGGFIAKAS